MKGKQLALAAFVVLAFVLYTLQQRHENSSPVIAPAKSTTGNSSQVSQAPSSRSPGTTQAANYKDGTYTGSVADAFYGNIQVQATISGGKITDVKFLQYPNDQENSLRINQAAMPYLAQEAIQAQNAHVDVISGATDTSNAFVESLGSALQKAMS